MKTGREILKILMTHKEELEKKYRVKEIGIFGSYARKEEKKNSDVDILVDFKEAPDLLEFIEIENYLRKLVKKKVDLVRRQAIRPELKERICNEVIMA